MAASFLTLQPLFEWYFFHKRDFPWRTEVYQDPHLWAYHTWICEVMSQQTLISVVVPKFNNFVKHLPHLHALANCEEELLRYLWSGLGYYARARNLQKGARTIIEKFHGQFPKKKEDWLTIPGCGDYTASIISSICFGEAVAAVDGNMIRVAARLLGMDQNVWERSGQQKIQVYCQQVMETFATKFKPGDINQAFMDFGSMVCKKQNPLCSQCPIQSSCLAYEKNMVEQCPPVKPRKETESEKIFAFAWLQEKTKHILLLERPAGFLSKTVGFPLFSQKEGYTKEILEKKFSQNKLKFQLLSKTFSHSITHHKITGHVAIVEGISQATQILEFYKSEPDSLKLKWVCLTEAKKHLSSSLDQKVLKLLS